ncbi:BaiN/RdsA family NAD(P)/FAD-dependent oxidoreductase [Clostridium botulinum]|uniref:Exported protein n=1 Tax=Clostridium botulinum (strain Hall / ATCC 3502 / NCTC 13319 / Type A) TaxID=441771 RepID=A5I2T2_CLOBH|nr:NAD(P)/FAD-dependent oxidoreductase [Clostridium botulinum]ABS32432.1 pyridine nucleotide-disulphide oxidoreductase family protein [Clostridium botulinum A str. ATCC 19397]ABS38932.1 pyridine nucleotide-disulphide oxidoreductase family protein [Clostridium botulinum A str. Hall]AWB17681.1 NAD(P)/FAD-dependent oxidoreductase [Clostridium botulinum]AWB30467.1 NAD(P)/FAD-dependent oxidoreductase [Clostridium botulinum]EGT5616793.1 NAD(P)/FAD-dependent oxidoreductase [Clostridium botulinum]
MSKIIVIGGGPAGMMAAIKAAEKHDVILIERNEKLGKKLYITGKGRCNVTSSKDISEFFDYIPTNPYFLYSPLYTFTNEDAIKFFNDRNIKLKVERGDRVFPSSDKSSDIIYALEKELIERNVKILLNKRITRIYKEDSNIKYVETEKGEKIKGDYFILCTGGVSYPQTGSEGDGHKIAKKLGHNIKELKPSLVPLETKEEWVKDLQGLALKNVEIKIIDSKNKTLYKNFGEMLFTHFGISGPIVLTASSVIDRDNLKVFINLKPALSSNDLDERIQKDFKKYCNRDFSNSINDLLPKKLIDIIINLSKIDPNKKVNSITKEERKSLVYLLQNLPLTVKGKRPIKEAIVTSGGVDVLNIDPSTMKSKIVNNLYFAGELIDVDAFTGGFNIQIALSTGYLAGLKVGEN